MAEDKKPGVPIEGQPPEKQQPEAPPAPEPGAQGVIPGMEGPRPRRTR